jgi:diacylglycerol kinase family enzyme
MRAAPEDVATSRNDCRGDRAEPPPAHGTLSRSRPAAWVALGAGAGALAALVVLLLRDFVALGEALVALALVSGAGWLALTRRGPVRAVAAAIVVVALGAGAVALVARGAVNELIAVGLTLAVFGISSRIALRLAARERSAPATRARPGSTAGGGRGRFVLLLNPRSGAGKVGRFDLVEEAKRRGIEPVVLGPGEDLVALAREVATSAEAIGMAGGDGSQALVAQVALDHELAYVCVPAGTRNHLALDLGLDREAVVAALDAYASDVEHRIDVGVVNERIFVNNVSLGIYAEIVQSEAYRDAKLETFKELLPGMLGPRATPFDLRFVDPERGERNSAQLVLVSNNPYRLDRLDGMGSRPRLDSGRLGIVTVEVKTTVEAAELAALEALGHVRRFPGWSEWTAEQFEIESDNAVAAGIDGEAVVLEPPLRFRIAPAALRVRLPPKAVGLSPAALAPGLTRAAFRELWQLAAGRS